jgi:hypothetical protein
MPGAGAWLCAAKVARKDQLRMEKALRLWHFPDVRMLGAFDVEALPPIDPGQVRALATCLRSRTRPTCSPYLISLCYQRGSVLITSSRPVME